jgi:DNA-binding NarL/FixJ family response regulator
MSETIITILLAEDDKVDQMAFGRFVRAAALPYVYHIANSCAEAYLLLQIVPFDVVIIEHGLCSEATFEVLSMWPDLPMIITSGIHNEILAEQAKQAGVSAYFTKDTEGTYLEALPLAIERAIKRRNV